MSSAVIELVVTVIVADSVWNETGMNKFCYFAHGAVDIVRPVDTNI